MAILLTPLFLNAQNPPAAEQQKIEALIKHVGDLKDAKFVRNGSTYEPATAVRFLRGKWNANKAGVKSARDFIENRDQIRDLKQAISSAFQRRQ